MKLSKICEEIEYTLLHGSMDAEVRDIVYDSRKIAPETMFVCMVGAVTDGHKYIPDAIEKVQVSSLWSGQKKLRRSRNILPYFRSHLPDMHLP